jgi:hypothetical protein
MLQPFGVRVAQLHTKLYGNLLIACRGGELQANAKYDLIDYEFCVF